MKRAILLLALIGFGILAYAYREATREPIVRGTEVALPDWPAGAPPVRVLLLSDLHVGGPDMPPERVARIVAEANRLRPDLVLLAGDFISDKRSGTRDYPYPVALAPLKALAPRLGSFAVLGNHDHWKDAAAARDALEAAGIRVLDNDAATAGPLVIGGLDDAFTGHDDLPATLARMRALPGAKLVLSHSPDPFPDLPSDATLMLAGHTHCGQVVLPLIGPLSTQSDYGRRYACGVIRERGRTLIVSAGLGTSILPLRLGAPPDMWLIELRGRP